MSAVAYLTFDDGPQEGTEDVLNALKETETRATFFLTGENVNALRGGLVKQAELVERMILEGHIIGNHGYSHSIQTRSQYLEAFGRMETTDQKRRFLENFEKNNSHFQRLIGTSEELFSHGRLPGDGRTFPLLIKSMVELSGLKHHAWNFEFAPNNVFRWVPERDWCGIAGLSGTSRNVTPQPLKFLLHDRHWGSHRVSILRELILHLKKTYKLETVEANSD